MHFRLNMYICRSAYQGVDVWAALTDRNGNTSHKRVHWWRITQLAANNYHPSKSDPTLLFEPHRISRILISWDVTLCRRLSGSRRFDGTCRLHVQGFKIREPITQPHSVTYQKNRIFEQAAVKSSKLHHIGCMFTYTTFRDLNFLPALGNWLNTI
jgi:hypothetical protein